MTLSLPFARQQAHRDAATRQRLIPIATREFIAWLGRNPHACQTALHLLKQVSLSDDLKACHLKSLMGHGYQGRYIDWPTVINWLKDQSEEGTSQTTAVLPCAEQSPITTLEWDYSDEERGLIQQAAQVSPQFAVGDHIIDDTGFLGTVIQVDKAEPDYVEIEYVVRRQRWAVAENLTLTETPPPALSIQTLLHAYQSCVAQTADTPSHEATWQSAHEQLRHAVALLLAPYLN